MCRKISNAHHIEPGAHVHLPCVGGRREGLVSYLSSSVPRKSSCVGLLRLNAGSRLLVASDAPISVNSADRPGETKAERDDRNLLELLQELRVAGLGVQVLFGFMLSLPFTTRFVQLSSLQRDLYVASLLLTAVSTALLMTPVAYHRLVFRRHKKERLVKDANVMALSGLAAVGLAISAVVLLVVSYVDKGLPAVIITVFIVCLFGALWFALPLARSRSRFPE